MIFYEVIGGLMVVLAISAGVLWFIEHVRIKNGDGE